MSKLRGRCHSALDRHNVGGLEREQRFCFECVPQARHEFSGYSPRMLASMNLSEEVRRAALAARRYIADRRQSYPWPKDLSISPVLSLGEAIEPLVHKRSCFACVMPVCRSAPTFLTKGDTPESLSSLTYPLAQPKMSAKWRIPYL